MEMAQSLHLANSRCRKLQERLLDNYLDNLPQQTAQPACCLLSKVRASCLQRVTRLLS